MIEVDGFYVNYYGDESVGVFSQEWEIKGYFTFENKEDLNEFKEKLKETWELCSDIPLQVETFQERKEYYEKFDDINNMFDLRGDYL